MERQLRDLMIAEAGDPPHRVTVEAVRRRAVRRWAAQAAAAGLAVVLAVGAGVGLSAAVLHTGPSPGGGTGQQAGPPRYYLSEYYDRAARKLVMAVQARTTGRVTALVRDPLPGSSCDNGGGADVAAADDQTFFMTCLRARWGPGRYGPHSKLLSVESYIYRFQVTGSGRARGYSLVKGSTLKGIWVEKIAATPDGSELAAEFIKPPPSGTMATNAVPAGILVINTRTGATALWHSGPYVPGAVGVTDGVDLSFAAGGRELVVLVARCHRTRYLSECNGNADMQVRAYGPAARGGSLEGGRVLLQDATLTPRGNRLSSAFISPDGSAVTAAMIRCPPHGACTLTVARIPVGTGGPQRVLYQVQSGTRYEGIFFRFLSPDPSRRYLILYAGAGSGQADGWIDRGRLVPLASANGNTYYETW